MACGLSVDLSEASEPTDELGDNPVNVEAGIAFPKSEADDVELPGCARLRIDCVVSCCLGDGAFSDKSLGKFFTQVDEVGAYAAALGDSPTLSDDALLGLVDGCKSG